MVFCFLCLLEKKKKCRISLIHSSLPCWLVIRQDSWQKWSLPIIRHLKVQWHLALRKQCCNDKQFQNILKYHETPSPKLLPPKWTHREYFTLSLPQHPPFPPATEDAFPASFILLSLSPAVLSPWCTWTPSQYHLANFPFCLPHKSRKRYFLRYWSPWLDPLQLSCPSRGCPGFVAPTGCVEMHCIFPTPREALQLVR